VSQHATHHIERHLEKTPIGYIQWRFQDGHDREILEKATRVLKDEEKALLDQEWVGKNGTKRKLEMIMGKGHALGDSVKSTIPVPREKCGCALVRILCHSLFKYIKNHALLSKYEPVGFPLVMGSLPNPSFHVYGIDAIYWPMANYDLTYFYVQSNNKIVFH